MDAQPGDSRGQERAGARSPRFRPDRQTELENELGYYSVFTPLIAPFKRISTFDEVAMQGRVPTLTIHQPRETTAVRTLSPDDAEASREQFWGSIVLDFRGGSRVPFPSVSPESRLLSLRFVPAVPIHLEKDGADNFTAVIDVNQRRMVRAIFLMDAPRHYFNAAEIPNVPNNIAEDRVHPLPPRVKRDALEFAQELSIEPGDPLDETLEVLTRHFRSFQESSEPPQNSGNIFLDLARGMRGVCRHRAYGFVITLMALGVPARFVQNEAHAFAEVFLPSIGFMRVDLGGAAAGLRALGADDRPVHRPTEPDPLPRPASYRASYSRGTNVSGLRSGSSLSSHGPGSSLEPLPVSTPPSTDAPAAAEPTSERTVVLVVRDGTSEVFRGQPLRVSGRATDQHGNGIEGLRIEVLLAGRGQLLLGVTLSGPGGYFGESFGVPPDLIAGDYHLLVRTPGSADYDPAQNR